MIHLRKQNLLQGNKQIENYFEGWYYKQVTGNAKYTISVIFGMATDVNNPHAFIQIIENIKKKSHYISFPLDSFLAKDNPFCIQIGNSYFYENKMVLDIQDPSITLQGTLYFENLTPLTPTLYRPTIMGPFSYMKNMECNHGIVSLHHTVQGTLQYGRKKIDFTDGIGYIEKDYGTSFPKDYIWTSSTHGKNTPSSFVLSIAHIPLGPTSFKGIICVLLQEDKPFYFTSYYGCHISTFQKRDHYIEIVLKQGFYTLKVDIEYAEDKSLIAPMKGQMHKEIKESLDATIQVKLYYNKDIMIVETFTHGGLEVV